MSVCIHSREVSGILSKKQVGYRAKNFLPHSGRSHTSPQVSPSDPAQGPGGFYYYQPLLSTSIINPWQPNPTNLPAGGGGRGCKQKCEVHPGFADWTHEKWCEIKVCSSTEQTLRRSWGSSTVRRVPISHIQKIILKLSAWNYQAEAWQNLFCQRLFSWEYPKNVQAFLNK